MPDTSDSRSSAPLPATDTDSTLWGAGLFFVHFQQAIEELDGKFRFRLSAG